MKRTDSHRWLWLLLLFIASPVWAQDYKTHYDLAMALYQAQKFDDSIPEFKAAYELDPKPGLLFNIAQAYRKAGKPREAIAYYDRYLAVEPRLDSDTRRKVDSYLAEARNTIAALELELKQRMAEEKARSAEEPPPTLQEPTPTAAPPPPPPPPPEKPIYKKGWFWGVTSAAVVVVVVGFTLGLTLGYAAGSATKIPDGTPKAFISF